MPTIIEPKMTRKIQCVFLKEEADGLEAPPYPGEIGLRIYENISKDAWRQWLERSVMIINEYQLNSSDEANQDLMEKHLLGFLFSEGEHGQMPQGFSPQSQSE